MSDARKLTEDPLREQLLSAASQVVAAKGYSGTKVMDIVRAAGLSSGALYGRFESKEELLTEAIVNWAERNSAGLPQDRPVADALVRYAMRNGPLRDDEAMRVEAYAAARREPDVAVAVDEARQRSQVALEGVLAAAVEDGSLPADADLESISYFLLAVDMGLLMQRAAGAPLPDPQRWQRFIELMVASMSDATVAEGSE